MEVEVDFPLRLSYQEVLEDLPRPELCVVDDQVAANLEQLGGVVPVQERNRESVPAVDQLKIKLQPIEPGECDIRRRHRELQAISADPVGGAELFDPLHRVLVRADTEVACSLEGEQYRADTLTGLQRPAVTGDGLVKEIEHVVGEPPGRDLPALVPVKPGGISKKLGNVHLSPEGSVTP